MYGVRRLTTHQILLVHYVEWEKDERGDARMGKWDGSNLVLFNRVYHHQEREDEVTRLATSAATDLFIHTGRVHYSGVVLHHRVWLVGGS